MNAFAQVNPGSKAALQGIREGDLITSINDRPTEGPVTNQEAHGLLKEAGPTLRLGLKQLSCLPLLLPLPLFNLHNKLPGRLIDLLQSK